MAKFYLKDWHGKEKEFTDEKIFVRGEDGELIQFTQGEGDKPAVVEPLEVTENGNYTPGEGVDGFNSVSVNVPDIPAVVQPLEVTENGTYTAPDGVDGYSPVTVNVASSGGGGGVPFLRMVGAITTNTNNTSVDTVQTLRIPKGATIVKAYAEKAYNIGKSYYPVLTSARNVSLDSLQVDTSYANYDAVSYTHKSGLDSYSAYGTFMFRVLVATDAITVKDAGGGLFAGTVNRNENSIYGGSDMGASQIMYLKTLDFAEGVTEAPAYVCSSQTLLESVDLSNIEKIGVQAFNGCTSLESVSLDNVLELGQNAFMECASLKFVSFGSNPISLGASAFLNCTSLESISLNNVNSLGQRAFEGCTSLTGELIIPDTITTLPSSVFMQTKFDRVVFPAGFSEIGYNAFYKCAHPTEFDFSACTAVPSLISSAYLGQVGNGQVIKVPSALFDTWSTKTGWKDWAAQMVAV